MIHGNSSPGQLLIRVQYLKYTSGICKFNGHSIQRNFCIMKIDLNKYMTERLHEECINSGNQGPVITISRLSGCPAKTIAKKLTENLTEKMRVKGIDAQWRMITKEIMSESAKALEVDPAKIKYIFDYEEKGVIDTILEAHLTKYYKSDRKIRSTIAKVISNIACEGYVVIVGRGGVALTHTIAKSLHISLEAPLEWRILRISNKHNLSSEEAMKYIMDVDKKRKQFRDYFEGKDTDYTWFDLTFNCMSLSEDEIVKIIMKAAEVRNLI
jgi:cytidylate kinase